MSAKASAPMSDCRVFCGRQLGHVVFKRLVSVGDRNGLFGAAQDINEVGDLVVVPALIVDCRKHPLEQIISAASDLMFELLVRNGVSPRPNCPAAARTFASPAAPARSNSFALGSNRGSARSSSTNLASAGIINANLTSESRLEPRCTRVVLASPRFRSRISLPVDDQDWHGVGPGHLPPAYV
jgi:hypothetical protein